MKLWHSLILVTLTALYITGCSASPDIRGGVSNMTSILQSMEQQIEVGNQAKVLEQSNLLEKEWSQIEDQVKVKSSEVYEKVEAPLTLIEAGAKHSPLDAKTLTQAVQKLQQALDEIK